MIVAALQAERRALSAVAAETDRERADAMGMAAVAAAATAVAELEGEPPARMLAHVLRIAAERTVARLDAGVSCARPGRINDASTLHSEPVVHAPDADEAVSACHELKCPHELESRESPLELSVVRGLEILNLCGLHGVDSSGGNISVREAARALLLRCDAVLRETQHTMLSFSSQLLLTTLRAADNGEVLKYKYGQARTYLQNTNHN